MTAIYKRDLKSFFHSFIGWLYLAVTFFMMGLYFYVYNMIYGYPTISFVLQSVVFLFIITVPIITMRSLAEDRKYKTDQLILTAPVSVGKIVLGKYLALVTLLAIPVILIGLMPFALMRAGTFQMGISYSALTGFFLYGCLALAIGLFVSSLTESVVISAVSTLGILFVGYIMTGICGLISSTGTTAFAEFISKILSAFDMIGRFDRLCTGYFDLTAVLYYITFTAFMLFATMQSIQKRRYSISEKGVRFGAYSLGAVLLAAALTVTVNILASRLPEKYTAFDMTSNKMYTLTEDTKQLVSGIDKDVTIYVLVDETAKDVDLDKTLTQIGELSDHVTIQYVSPVTNPKFYYNYTEEQPSNNSLIVVSDSGSKVVDYQYLYTIGTDFLTGEYQVTGYDGEGQILAALSYVLSDEIPKFYIIQSGHGELQFEDIFLNALDKENVAYETLALYSVEEIPSDAQGIIINAPTSDYSKEDADKVIAYLEQGGNAFLIPTWTDAEMQNFESVLDFYGISLAEGVIVEQDKNFYNIQSPYNLIPKINDDEVTQKIAGQSVFAPLSRGLLYDDERDDIHYTPLLETSDSAFSKVDISAAQYFVKQEEDIDGPFVIAMEAEKATASGNTSKAYIVATEYLFTSDADEMFPGNNMKLFGSMVSALSDRTVSTFIPVKYFTGGYLIFNAAVILLAEILAVIVIPAGCLVIGFIIWFKRRRM